MATTYRLQIRLLPGGDWDDVVGTISPNSDGELSQIVGSLVTGDSYEFRFVRDVGGVRAFSNVVSATTKVPAVLKDKDPIEGLGTFEFDGETNTIARSSGNTVIQFANNAWRAVGITYDPGSGVVKPFIPGTPSNTTLSGFTLDSAKVYLEKLGARAVTVKLPSTANFELTVSAGQNKNFTFSVVAT